MHEPIPRQGRWLTQVVRGYFRISLCPTNRQRMNAFRCHVMKLWHRTLRRRSQKDFTSWDDEFVKFAARLVLPLRSHPSSLAN